MEIIVKKYGGSSVANIEKIKNVARQIAKAKEEKENIVVVISALGDTTDKLIELAHQIISLPNKRELDMLLSTGEQASAALLSMTLNAMNVPAIGLVAHQIEILTDDSHSNARIKKISTERILKELEKSKVVVVAGFQGITIDKDITTLGRGGSDTTAVALASILNADICEIFTDVEGVYSGDPQIIPKARKLEVVSYEEMLEMASAGAKVLQARSVEMAKKFGVKIHVKSSFKDMPGTIVCEEVVDMEEVLVSAITTNVDECKVSILEIPDSPGIAAEIFGELAEANINIDMIVQVSSSGEKKTTISFTVSEGDLLKTLEITQPIGIKLKAKDLLWDKDVGKVSVVGVGMRTHAGIAATMFKALAEVGINIEMISTSEIKISCIIRQNRIEEAAKTLHSVFNLDKK